MMQSNGESEKRALTVRTQTIHAGAAPLGHGQALGGEIVQSSVYGFREPADASARREAGLPIYARDHFPSQRSLETAIAELEGAESAHVTPSGMAAIALTALALLTSGDRVIIGADGYCDTEELFLTEFPRLGIETTVVDLTDLAAVEAALRPTTRLVLAETITNPGMRVPDLAALAALLRPRGILLAVDNTFATPVLCRPLALGADLVIHSVTKFLGGHHDLVAGAVAGPAELVRRISRSGYFFGRLPGSFDAWLALRGLRTLAARMAWICPSAETVATFLAGHPAVRAVRYPGLRDAPDAEVVRRQLSDGAGGVLVFDLDGDRSTATQFMRDLRLIPYAGTLGGVESTICYPPVRDAVGAPPDVGSLRLSVGLEAPEDLIADLAGALANVRAGIQ